MAMLWAVATTLYHRRQTSTAIAPCPEAFIQNDNAITPNGRTSLGTLSYSTDDDCFYAIADGQPIKFTPMQQQLMQMFFSSNSHQLTKAEICSALWPKKPDASETLYTLIRRVKPIVEAYGLAIEVERGKAYRLTTLGGTASEPYHAARTQHIR